MPSDPISDPSPASGEKVDFFEAQLTLTHFIDNQMSRCTGAEVKVFLQCWRKTHGFHKRSARISLDQLCSGTRKKTGEVFDEGTGLHRETAAIARRGVIARGLIIRGPGSGAGSDRSRSVVRVPTPEAVKEILKKQATTRHQRAALPAPSPVGISDPAPVGNSDFSRSENPTPKSYIDLNPPVSECVAAPVSVPACAPTHPPLHFSDKERQPVRDLLNRTLASKLHQIPDDAIVDKVLRSLNGAPPDQLEHRIRLRLDSISSYGLVPRLAADCAECRNVRKESETDPPPRRPMSKAEEFEERFYRGNPVPRSQSGL